MKNKNFGGNEILHVADAVARDKGIKERAYVVKIEACGIKFDKF